MPKLKFLVSLTTNDNDYQAEQASSAEQAARKFGIELQILYADNDAINQSTQILKAIQAAEEDRPNAIVFEPVGGTALPQVARAAASAGIGWAVLNRDANYISELRQDFEGPHLCRELRPCGNRPNSGTPMRGFVADRRNYPLYPGPVGEFRSKGTHAWNAWNRNQPIFT